MKKDTAGKKESVTEQRFFSARYDMQRFKSAGQPEQRYTDSWLMTYTDLVTLLITLFVLLLANSTYGKDADGSATLFGSLWVLEEAAGYEVLEDQPQSLPTRNPDIERKAKNLRALMEQSGFSDGVEIEALQEEIAIRISDKVLFPSGSAEMLDNSDSILKAIGTALTNSEQTIVVEGHTDNIPIATPRYPSNWELSASRAISVAKALIEHGIIAQRIQVAAFADTRPIASNEMEDGRQKNRRVEIILR